MRLLALLLIYTCILSLSSCRSTKHDSASKDVTIAGEIPEGHPPAYDFYYSIDVIEAASGRSETYICKVSCAKDFRQVATNAERKTLCPDEGTAIKKSEFTDNTQQQIIDVFLEAATNPNKNFAPKPGAPYYDPLIAALARVDNIYRDRGQALEGCGKSVFDSIFEEIEPTDNASGAIAPLPRAQPAPTPPPLRKVMDVPGRGTLYLSNGEYKFKFLTGENLHTANVQKLANRITKIMVNGVQVFKKVHSCFPAGTMVQTPLGDRAIEELRVGDEVISYDLEADRFTTSKIVDLLSHRAVGLGRFALSNGKTIFPTPAHPFYSLTRQEWVNATQLQVGEKLLYLEEETLAPVSIDEIRFFESEQTVYNFTVLPQRNYFAEGVLVHNY